jgi:ribosomal-protein-alanine N-acetyltransferase
MELEIKIEHISKDDIDEVIKIENSSFSSPWSRQLFLDDFNNEYSHIYIARKNESGRVCGYICFSLIFEELHILNLAVDRVDRRKGVATRLLLHSLDLAGQKGAKYAFLEVRESHEAARRLYRNNGFIEVARRKKYYSDNGEDAIIMINHLKDAS